MKYEFYQDVKVTAWERRKCYVEANTKEEAIQFIKNNVYEDDVWNLEDDTSDKNVRLITSEVETLFDFTEFVSPEENGGPTIEWIDPNNNFETVARNWEE